MRVRRLAVPVAIVLLIQLIGVSASVAADQVTVPTSVGQVVTVTWQGTVLPGANATSDCSGTLAVVADAHDVNVLVPAGTYSQVAVAATVSIAFQGNADLILTVVGPDGRALSADSGSFGGGETVSFSNPPQGAYKFLVCAFAAVAPQAYAGTLTLTAGAPPPAAAPTCPAPGKPLKFGAPSYVDRTRAGGEPSVVAHPDGTLLYAAHAGTTHFYSLEADDPDSEAFFENYRGQVHAWYSTDQGATWTFVDRTLPPDNAPGSGFSDPDFAIDAAGNVYLSEINLVNVGVSRSTNSGRSYTLQNFFAQTITDRQWTAAGPTNVLFIVGNPDEGGTFPTDPVGHQEHTIYRSTDGGKVGVGLLSHWPAIDVDAKGNLYIAWDESGNGGRPAGIWYASSTTGGRTWSAPARVDPDDRTDIWPWIAVGDPGKVAVAWFGNDHALPGNDAEQAGANDPWNVYVAQTQNGLGCLGSNAPGFRTTRATPEPFHVGTICMGGTVCQAELVDRRLGDYFTIDVDTTGALVAAYSDTRQGGSVSLPAFLRQTGGPAFSKGKPIKSGH